MKLFLCFCLITVNFCTTSCSNETLSSEDEIKLFIENAKLAAEQRSTTGLADLVDEAYKDQRAWNKAQIKKVARTYFFMHKNIHLLTKINSINFQDDDNAFVVLHVAMAGNVITDLNSLSSLRARIYKFELQLIKHDVWLLQQAKWVPANIKDMF